MEQVKFKKTEKWIWQCQYCYRYTEEKYPDTVYVTCCYCGRIFEQEPMECDQRFAFAPKPGF